MSIYLFLLYHSSIPMILSLSMYIIIASRCPRIKFHQTISQGESSSSQVHRQQSQSESESFWTLSCGSMLLWPNQHRYIKESEYFK